MLHGVYPWLQCMFFITLLHCLPMVLSLNCRETMLLLVLLFQLFHFWRLQLSGTTLVECNQTKHTDYTSAPSHEPLWLVPTNMTSSTCAWLEIIEVPIYIPGVSAFVKRVYTYCCSRIGHGCFVLDITASSNLLPQTVSISPLHGPLAAG